MLHCPIDIKKFIFADCLERIIIEFAERRNKQQIIKRMLQLHIIADKSEILPSKQPKRKSKKRNNTSDEDDEDMAEPIFIGSASKSIKFKPNKPNVAKSKQRKIVRTPLDVGTVRGLIQQVDAEKYQEAIDWLKECLIDAAEDTEEPSEDDDGVPLLPLLEVQKQAMEDAQFQKVLVSLGMQPPIVGMENYWRIPIYLNSADLQLRAKMLAGEEIVVNVEDIEDEDAIENEDAGERNNQSNNEAESEEDYFDGYMQRQQKQLDNLEEYMEKRLERMNSLMYSKSDNEDEQRQPIKSKKLKTKKEQKKKAKSRHDSDESSVDDVEEIKQKLEKKKKHNLSDSSEDESGEKNKKPKPTKKKSQTYEDFKPPSQTVADDLFNQLKAKRATKTKLSDMVLDVVNTEESDELNFNSEDYRQRLAELGDSDDDGDNDEEKTFTETTMKNRSRRANVIDSDDSDEQENENDIEQAKVINSDNNNKVIKDDAHVDDVDKTANQPIDEATTSISALNENKKRRRSVEHSDDVDFDSVDDEDEDVLFIKRKKPTKEEQKRTDTGEEPAKRRRIAVIDDDDDEDNIYN